MKYSFLLAFFLLISSHSYSQKSAKIIDSLKIIITTNPKDSIKIKTYSDLCWYYGRVSNDSAFHYGNLALNLSKKTNNLIGEAQAYNDLGIIYTYTSNFNEAIKSYRKSLKIRENIHDTLGIASIYNKLAFSYHKTFQMDSCISYNMMALDIYETLNDKRRFFLSKGNIAAIYQDMKQYDNALKVHFETLELSKEINDSLGLSNIYLNISNTYISKKDTILGLNYLDKSIEIAETFNYDNTLSEGYLNYGKILEQKQQQKALYYYEKSLEISTKIKNDIGITKSILKIANINTHKGKYKEAKIKLNKGLKLSKKIKLKQEELKAYEFLMYYYIKNINKDSIIYYSNSYKKLSDSIYSNRVTKEISEVQEKYNTAERQKEILTQRALIAENKLHLNRKNTQLISISLIAILLTILGYFLYNQQKLKNRQLQKEVELKEALTKIETQNKLQEQRLKISRDLHDNIGAQLTFIISSIENLQYGFQIKNKKLTNKLTHINDFTKGTIYELRDTIWAMNKNSITMDDLKGRISNFIDKANLASNAVNFNFNIEENITKEEKFTSVKGMNIYRIVQEAIHNAIKYADAKQISVSISKKNNQYQIEITDNGIGFKITEVSKGNGLANIKKRASDINGTIHVESEVNKGTRIILNC